MPRMQAIRCACAALVLAGLTVCIFELAHAQPSHSCADAATEQARKLLAFHFGSSDRIDIAPSVKTLSPIPNPANRKQRFDVLEIWGYLYKGRYRMRFIYAQQPGECVLMGQEILEYASL
jgi:hypothetical protein